MDAVHTPDPKIEPIRSLPPGARALVMEDRRHSAYCRDTLRPGLQSLGLEVFLTPSAERARRILSSVPIDLLVVDLSASGNRQTLEWLRAMRADYPGLVFIATADEHSDELERFCDALGAAAFLALPVSFRTLRRCVERAFVTRRHLLEMRRLERQLEAAKASVARMAPAEGGEPEHQVDDLWFAIFEQLLSGKSLS